MGYAGAEASTVAAQAAIAQAIRASGAIIRVKPEAFLKLLSRSEEPLVVTAPGGVFKKHFQYLTGYKGLIFHAQSPEPLAFSMRVEIVAAEKIWIPA
jgi:hypothetical protein